VDQEAPGRVSGCVQSDVLVSQIAAATMTIKINPDQAIRHIHTPGIYTRERADSLGQKRGAIRRC
jgi:hypothetical protein